MKVAIITSTHKPSQQVKKRIQAACQSQGLTIDDQSPDMVISVGGDGTLLQAFHRYEDQLDHIRFVGIHTGHLGFYTDWIVEELDDFLLALREEQTNEAFDSISYPLLEVNVKLKDGSKQHHIALNEAALRRYEGTMTTEVYIKDRLFELFKGDGLCISTPTGSTGLNKSLGGAVIHPRLDAIQLTEIASLNNRVYRTLSSSMLIPADEYIRLYPQTDEMSGVMLAVDQETYPGEEIVEIQFQVAKERVHFARYRHTHFWNRVKNSFIGG
ncbi:MAG: NAD kinase [Aerococcus suis]|nr:NAD kinase [Aerococcus suis]MDD7759026.1 NAD kinase [Aerococcus suis]MDY4646099.1 NAD kinase [Aerococcus suis]